MQKHSDLPGPARGSLRRNGERYLPQFKERVVSYAASHTFKETSEHFGVHHTTVSQWVGERKGKVNLGKRLTKSKNAAGKLKKPSVEPGEEQFQEWLEFEICIDVDMINREMILNKARELLEENGASDWFKGWVSRLEDEEERSDGTHLAYPTWFKHIVVNVASARNQSEACKIFGVSRRRVYQWLQGVKDSKQRGGKDGRSVTCTRVDRALLVWVKSEYGNNKPKCSIVQQKAREMYREAGYTMACSKGWFSKWCKRHNIESSPRAALGSDLEGKLLQWTLTQFDRHIVVNHTALKNQASLLVQTLGGGSDDSEFHASPSWVLRFCRRNSALLHRKPDVTENMFPMPMIQQMNSFRQTLAHLSMLGCMDELPINFRSSPKDMERPAPTGSTGSKRNVLLPRCPSQRCHGMVILSALENGQLLPPTLLLKGSLDEVQECPEVVSGFVYVLPQSKSVMEVETMNKWIDEVWLKYAELPNVLIVDSLDIHNDPVIVSRMEESGSYLAVIPGGCTPLLQPLELGGLATWFLESLQQKFAQYGARLPIAERPLAPDNADLVRWVGELYHEAQGTQQQDMIHLGFKKAGLRSEDEMYALYGV